MEKTTNTHPGTFKQAVDIIYIILLSVALFWLCSQKNISLTINLTQPTVQTDTLQIKK